MCLWLTEWGFCCLRKFRKRNIKSPISWRFSTLFSTVRYQFAASFQSTRISKYHIASRVQKKTHPVFRNTIFFFTSILFFARLNMLYARFLTFAPAKRGSNFSSVWDGMTRRASLVQYRRAWFTYFPLRARFAASAPLLSCRTIASCYIRYSRHRLISHYYAVGLIIRGEFYVVLLK